MSRNTSSTRSAAEKVRQSTGERSLEMRISGQESVSTETQKSRCAESLNSPHSTRIWRRVWRCEESGKKNRPGMPNGITGPSSPLGKQHLLFTSHQPSGKRLMLGIIGRSDIALPDTDGRRRRQPSVSKRAERGAGPDSQNPI